MAEQSVVIKVKADVSKATNDVKALQQAIAKLSKSSSESNKNLNSPEIKNASSNYKKVKQAIHDATDAQQRLNEETARAEDVTKRATYAGVALTQGFSDIGSFGMGAAQGIRAVANNAQQFTQALAGLKQKLNEGESAFQAITGSLMGPNKFLFTLTLAIAAIELVSNLIQKMGKDAKETANALEGFFSVISQSAPSAEITFEDLKQLQTNFSDATKESSNELKTQKNRVHDLSRQLRGVLTPALREQLKAEKENAVERVKILKDQKARYDAITESLSEQVDEQERIRQALIDLDTVQGRANFKTNISALYTDELRKKTYELRVEIQKLTVARTNEMLALELQNQAMEGALSFKKVKEFIGVDPEKQAAFSIFMATGILTGPEDLKNIEEKFKKFFSGIKKAEERGADARQKDTDEIKKKLERAEEDYFKSDTTEADLLSYLKNDPILRYNALLLEMREDSANRLRIQSEKLYKTQFDEQGNPLGVDLPDITQEVLLGIRNEGEIDTRRQKMLDFAEASASVAKTHAAALGGIGTAMMQMAKQGETVNRSQFETGKKFAIAQALVATYAGAAESLKLGPIAGPIAAASVIAQGMVQVNAIRRMKPGSDSGGSSAAGIRGAGNLQEFNVGNLYSGTPNLGSAAGFPSLSIASMAPQGMQLQLVARGPDLVSAVDAQRSANTRLIGGSR